MTRTQRPAALSDPAVVQLLGRLTEMLSPKIATPSVTFAGHDTESPSDFTTSLDTWFTEQNVEEAEQANIAFECLRGEAATWAAAYRGLVDWKMLATEIRRKWDSTSTVSRLKSRLYGAPQEAIEHAAPFILRKIALFNRLDPSADEETRVALIVELLHHRIRPFLRGQTIDSINHLVQLCTSIEEDLDLDHGWHQHSPPPAARQHQATAQQQPAPRRQQQHAAPAPPRQQQQPVPAPPALQQQQPPEPAPSRHQQPPAPAPPVNLQQHAVPAPPRQQQQPAPAPPALQQQQPPAPPRQQHPAAAPPALQQQQLPQPAPARQQQQPAPALQQQQLPEPTPPVSRQHQPVGRQQQQNDSQSSQLRVNAVPFPAPGHVKVKAEERPCSLLVDSYARGQWQTINHVQHLAPAAVEDFTVDVVHRPRPPPEPDEDPRFEFSI